MSIEFLPPDLDELTPRITVIGVGGAGGNAIANMIRADVQGVDFLVANTDSQALKQSSAPNRIQLGAKITQGLGAGSRPEIGRAAAEETIEAVQKALQGSHMVFIAAGMGGGTGTGAAPVIAKTARDMGVLTVGVVTKPFAFEGRRRAQAAEAGIEELQKYVDTLIVIPNQNLFLIANANTTFKEAFELADEVLQQGVRGITDLMVMPGLINLDFADVRSVMQEMGKAMMGTGEAEGDDRAIIAAQKAIANPLLDGVSMNGAKGVIVSITGGEDMRLLEVDEAANHIRELVDPDANIIWGLGVQPRSRRQDPRFGRRDRDRRRWPAGCRNADRHDLGRRAAACVFVQRAAPRDDRAGAGRGRARSGARCRDADARFQRLYAAGAAGVRGRIGRERRARTRRTGARRRRPGGTGRRRARTRRRHDDARSRGTRSARPAR